ncbi:phosphatase PAP2 family protein [Streptococcus cuniculi]|uniref:Phosphatase PAP2 family protein n=1 Tax=Streptococcus cuniculi TaxID=1432788 RepID=A0A4Y9JD98_9STRE|nr:phosphatase PAP2 family protein [Streptococcus cuniculi]MBF0777198.1 phosphatase PAP2 family protein [Streptococcus cuniculi]TFU98807.1 phosphatase PAP2 family protein [Streptococcus cuniculi]
MKNRQLYFRNASFAALFFVILGYVVKFYPQQLVGFDSSIQTALRGDFPAFATLFWTTITLLGNVTVLLPICLAVAFYCYQKRWKSESYFILSSFAVMGVLSTALKYVYQRPRPSIEWLVDTPGYSFPSWHAASTLMVAGVMVILVQQHLKTTITKRIAQAGLIILAMLVGISRIYVGVHYPTDIIGGWLLATSLLYILFPFYDRLRFQWRFQGKQK